jgi:hypothetical protein
MLRFSRRVVSLSQNTCFMAEPATAMSNSNGDGISPQEALAQFLELAIARANIHVKPVVQWRHTTWYKDVMGMPTKEEDVTIVKCDPNATMEMYEERTRAATKARIDRVALGRRYHR